MTKDNEQVAIAKDVLQLLDTRKIKAMSGTWVDFGPVDGLPGTVADMKKGKYECSTCAGGALFVAYMLRRSNDEDERLGWISAETLEEALREVFPRDQIILIDIAFERGGGYFNYVHFDEHSRRSQVTSDFQEQLDRARDFCEDIESEETYGSEPGSFVNPGAEKRLRLIMNNIIENQGEFKP